MKKINYFVVLSLTMISFSTWSLPFIYGQDFKVTFPMDSTVVNNADGSIEVEYRIRPYEFGNIVRCSNSGKLPLLLTEDEKEAFLENYRKERRVFLHDQKKTEKSVSTDFSSYSVGTIPMEEGMTPFGAKTYQIPVQTAPGIKLVPSVSIGYNSQSADGWAGYGWDINGLSSIVLISKNLYYHGTQKSADTADIESVFALDGVPLVKNIQPATMSSYSLITATGNVLVAPQKNTKGYVIKFNVLYPNGTVAEFGTGTNTDTSMPSYPIVQLTDLEGNKITFSYHYDPFDNMDRINTIRFGYDASGRYKGEILFDYKSNAGYISRHYAGKVQRKGYLLTGIQSKNNGNILCKYTFSYELKDNVNLLNKVECLSEGESLPPLKFEYGLSESSSSVGHLVQDDWIMFDKAFTSKDKEIVYRRGKFVESSHNDGLLMYPGFLNYEAIMKKQAPFFGHWHYEYGSLYPKDQEILVVPSLKDFGGVKNTIVTGSGFQTIEAVDVDGDGLDEIVKVNFNGISGTSTRLLITVYKCTGTGNLVQKDQFNVLLNGTVENRYFVSPYRREYFWGDFKGDGKIQLLAVAYDKNYNTKKNLDQICYASLIDIAERKKISDIKLFDFTENDIRNLFTYDLDNDGRTELCYGTPAGLDVFRLQPSSSFKKEKTYSQITSYMLSSTTRPCYITDFDGDGYIDILRAPAVNSDVFWYRYAFNGNDFVTHMISVTLRKSDDVFMFIDVNQDGLTDLVKINGTKLGTYINEKGLYLSGYHESPENVTDSKGIIPANIVNFGSPNCFIKVDGFFVYKYRYTSLSPELRLLTLSTDSQGVLRKNTYAYLPSHSLYLPYNAVVNNAEGYVKKSPPVYVLEFEEAYLPPYVDAQKIRNREYSYYGGVFHKQGLGFCGFSKIRTYEYDKGTIIEIIDEIRDPLQRGVVTLMEKRRKNIWILLV